MDTGVTTQDRADLRRRRAVVEGERLLDADLHEVVPHNWRGKVDPNKLNMASDDNCVLGQLFGSYIEGLHALHLTADEADEYGFIILDEETRWFSIMETHHLTPLWQAVLRGKDTLPSI